jgi:hypothetical protein
MGRRQQAVLVVLCLSVLCVASVAGQVALEADDGASMRSERSLASWTVAPFW